MDLKVKGILRTLKYQLEWRPPAQELRRFKIGWINIWGLTDAAYDALDKNRQDCLSLVVQLERVLTLLEGE